jgi:hypothetical protein
MQTLKGMFYDINREDSTLGRNTFFAAREFWFNPHRVSKVYGLRVSLRSISVVAVAVARPFIALLE